MASQTRRRRLHHRDGRPGQCRCNRIGNRYCSTGNYGGSRIASLGHGFLAGRRFQIRGKTRTGDCKDLDPALYQAQVENQRANLANAEAAVQAAKSDIGNQEANLEAARANQDAARVASVDATDLLKRDQEMTDVIAGRDVEVAKAAAD